LSGFDQVLYDYDTKGRRMRLGNGAAAAAATGFGGGFFVISIDEIFAIAGGLPWPFFSGLLTGTSI
jgi:hypothetical protein